MQIPSVKVKLKGNEIQSVFTLLFVNAKNESMSGALKTINKLVFYRLFTFIENIKLQMSHRVE